MGTTSYHAPSVHGWKDIPFMITLVALAAGGVLTILSWLHLCTGACAESHEYRFFGLPLEPIGLAFFIAMIVLHLLSRGHPPLSMFVLWGLSGAIGMEGMLIFIQKHAIGHWCPMCLSIAACAAVALIGVSIIYGRAVEWNMNRGKNMKKQIAQGLLSLPALLAGFFIAFAGLAKPDTSFAAVNSANTSPGFGNLTSPIEVYVITDWFCPSCREVEKKLEASYPEIMKKATIVFVDYAVHPESTNFIPYNLSFMLYNKEKYIETRHKLHALADETKTPTAEQVQAAVRPLGITYRSLNYSDVNSAIQFFTGLVKTYDVEGTPTVIVANRKKIQARKLSGSGQISSASIMKAIDEVSKAR